MKNAWTIRRRINWAARCLGSAFMAYRIEGECGRFIARINFRSAWNTLTTNILGRK